MVLELDGASEQWTFLNLEPTWNFGDHGTFGSYLGLQIKSQGAALRADRVRQAKSNKKWPV